MHTIRESVKWLLYPGINLHARLRYRVLPKYLPCVDSAGEAVLLDAGCGNGMLTYRAYQRGYRAIGISIKADEIRRNKQLFNDRLGIPESRLSFVHHNLYELNSLDMKFDHIICSEVLEHIKQDAAVCHAFHASLKDEGMLHLCCPNAEHPDNRAHVLDLREEGGHVRPGYTLQSYRQLLEPIGFAVSECIGLGGAIRQNCNKLIRGCESRIGLPAAVALFFILAPLTLLDSDEPSIPYSLYVRAQKVGISTNAACM